ncbi:MAG: M13 family metallopeptidase [Gammaproteobacteria bacterium]|nr:M13 family metallopeptidase [Gammaproteobacteria bacterium]
MRQFSILALALLLLACDRPQEPPIPTAPPPPAANQPAARGFDPADLDMGIRPQDDFWRHVNGKWLAQTEIPADWSGYGTFQMLAERTEAQLRALIETAQKSAAPAGTDAQKIAALYASYMDEGRLETLGLAPLAADLAAIAALRTHDEVIAWMGSALATGIQVPLEFHVDADASDPSRNLAYIWQGGLGLPDRDYYLDDTAELAETRAAYVAHIGKLFRLAGWKDPDAPAVIMAIEQRIAEKHWSAVQNRDDEKIYSNQVDFRQAQTLSPGFDWPRFFKAAQLEPPNRFVLAQTDYFAALGQIIQATPVRDWQTWLRFKLLKSYAPYLNAAIVAEDFDFQGRVLRGQQQNKARWKLGVRLVNNEMGELLGKSYVERHFPPASKQRIEQLIADLRAAFHESIDQLDWMTPATRAAAQAKLASFRSKIGYPERWRDYSALDIKADDLIGNLRRTRAFAHRHEADKLNRPVDRNEWFMPPQMVNAYYQPTWNEIVFPAAILQPPFFDPAADDAWNYGAIGAVIGHEFSHGFDDQGRKFDGEGRLRDWWTPADAKRYTQRAQRLVEQYNRFRPLPNFSVNGELTLGENLADLAGLVMAYRAWQNSLHGKEAPVIGGFSGAQRFFYGYAISFRGKDRPESLQAQLLSDPHSPDEYRVTGALQNMPAFYAAFGITATDRMFLAPEQRLAIW